MGVGPVEENSTVEITCESKGGRPTPTLTWWRAGQQLISTTFHENDLTWSVINLEASRDLLKSPLLCHASITHPPPELVRPKTTAVSIDITCKLLLFN